MKRLLPALLLASITGCGLIKFNVSTPGTRKAEEEERTRKAEEERVAAENTRREAEAQRVAAAEAEANAALAEIEALRAAAGNSPQDALAFARKVQALPGTAAAAKVDLPALTREAADHLDRNIQSAPTLELFDALALLPPGPDTDPRVVRACAKARPLVPADRVGDFIGECLARANGDERALTWPSAKKDLIAYRKAEAAQRAAEEKARKEAEAAAAQSMVHTAAAVFAAGRCNFGNCMKDGWTARTDQGEIQVRCNFGNCLKDGWSARLPAGGEAQTRCNFGNCMKDGWETRYPDGSTANTRCNFGKCESDGWETNLPSGDVARTRCNFSKCFTDGWETSLPDGGSVRCRCSFGDCLSNGAECS